MGWFTTPKYTSLKDSKKKKEIPEGIWTKCPSCDQMLMSEQLEKNHLVCPKCDYYFNLTAWQRIDLVSDQGSFQEMFDDIVNREALLS